LAAFNEENRALPQDLPLYCAVVVRLYTKKYHARFLEALRKGEFREWIVFTAALETAMYFLPKYKNTVYRGVNYPDISLIHHQMLEASDFVYISVGVISTSTELTVAEKFVRCSKLNPTLYELQVTDGRDISMLSELPTEKEILLPLFTAWIIKSHRLHESDSHLKFTPVRYIQAIQFKDAHTYELSDLVQSIRDDRLRTIGK
jgi:hypothetical protein